MHQNALHTWAFMYIAYRKLPSWGRWSDYPRYKWPRWVGTRWTGSLCCSPVCWSCCLWVPDSVDTSTRSVIHESHWTLLVSSRCSECTLMSFSEGCWLSLCLCSKWTFTKITPLLIYLDTWLFVKCVCCCVVCLQSLRTMVLSFSDWLI